MAKGVVSKKMHLMALENAAAFIGNHGEEGGIEEDHFEDKDAYLRSCKQVEKKLLAEAARYKKKWKL